MFEIGDAVLVTSDWEANNCKNKTGVIVKLGKESCEIRFDTDQNVKYRQWWVSNTFIKKQNRGEY